MITPQSNPKPPTPEVRGPVIWLCTILVGVIVGGFAVVTDSGLLVALATTGFAAAGTFAILMVAWIVGTWNAADPRADMDMVDMTKEDAVEAVRDALSGFATDPRGDLALNADRAAGIAVVALLRRAERGDL